MYDIITTAGLWLWFITMGSVCWDHFSYTSRQTEWERKHPGKTYIPGYKRKAFRDKIDAAL